MVIPLMFKMQYLGCGQIRRRNTLLGLNVLMSPSAPPESDEDLSQSPDLSIIASQSLCVCVARGTCRLCCGFCFYGCCCCCCCSFFSCCASNASVAPIQHSYVQEKFTTINMLAFGTGIAACYRVLKAIHADEADDTRVNLIYSNVIESDAMLVRELFDLQQSCRTLPDGIKQFCVQYWFQDLNLGSRWNEPPFNGRVGSVTATIIAQLMPFNEGSSSPAALGLMNEKTIYLCSGPSDSVASARVNLKRVHVPDDRIVDL